MIAVVGRSAERPVLSEEEIGRNVDGIRAILENLLQPREGAPGSPPAILNNLVADDTSKPLIHKYFQPPSCLSVNLFNSTGKQLLLSVDRQRLSAF